MGCDCGKPKCDGHCGVSPAVLQINNPSECVLFHRVEVPASMGDSTTNPPKPGAYKNTLLYYKADGEAFFYSSDGIPTKITGVTSNYACLENKPQINGVTLEGNKTSSQLGLDDLFYINVTNVDFDEGTFAADKTYAEILEAYNAGKLPIVIVKEEDSSHRYDGIYMLRTYAISDESDGFDFVNVDATGGEGRVEAGSWVIHIGNNENRAAESYGRVEIDSSLNQYSDHAVRNSAVYEALSQKVNQGDLAAVATSGSYSDLSGTPTIPTVNNATLTIQKNGADVQTFTANQSTNATANITVPTKTSDLANDGATGASVYIEESDIAPSELSGEGEFITLNGTTDCSILDTQLLGNAEQTTYSGKNLLNASANLNSVSYDLSFTSDGNGKITWTGTPTATYALATTIFDVNMPAGTYTFSIDNPLPHRIYLLCYLEDNSTFYWIIEPNQTSATNTFTQAVTKWRLDISGLSTSQAYNESIKPQVESGSSATEYERFVGGVPAPNPSYPQPISTVTGGQTVKVVGKNLFDMDDFLTAAEVTYTKDGGQYSITAWGDLISIRYPLQNIKTGNTYTISLDGVAQSTTSTRLQVYKNGSVVGTIYGGTDHQEHSYTFTADGSQYELNATYSSPFSSPVIFKNPQLELGSTATNYEAYQGQSYELNLGKNLLDNKATTRTYLGITLTKNNDGSITLNGTSEGNAQFYLDVDGAGFQGRNSHLGAGTYTINGIDSGGVKFEINYQTANGSSKYSWGTFTVAEPFNYGVYVNVTNGTYVNNLRIYPQLERGSQATTYAPYFTPIELAKVGTYQDRIYKDEGKWYIEKQVEKAIFDGSTTLTQLQASTKTTRVVATIDSEYGAPLSTVQLPLSDYFTGNSSVWSTDVQGAYIQGRYTVLRANNATVGATLDSFKAWLTSHPTTVYYALETPTTTEITDETLLAQLEELAGALGYDGVTNIMSTSPELPAILSVSTYTDSVIPSATRVRAGIVRIGDGIDVDDCGTISVSAQEAPTVITIDLGDQSDWSVVHHSIGPMLALGAGGVSSSQYDNRVRVVPLTPPTSTTFHNENTDTDMTLEEVFNLIESGEDVVFNNVPVGTYYDSRSEVYYPLDCSVNGVRLSDKLNYSNGAAFTGHVAIEVPSPQSLDTQWDYSYPIVASISIRKLVVINGDISTTSYYLDVDGVYDGIVAD